MSSLCDTQIIAQGDAFGKGKSALCIAVPSIWADRLKAPPDGGASVCQKRAAPFFDKRVFAPTRAFSRIKCVKTHSGPTSAVGSAEASSAGPRPAQSIFRDVHAAAKNGSNLIRGLRAANSARLFLQTGGPARWRGLELCVSFSSSACGGRGSRYRRSFRGRSPGSCRCRWPRS